MKKKGAFYTTRLFIVAFIALLSVVSFTGCATTYRLTTYPNDAQLTLKNPITQETFDLGKGHVEFGPKGEYGDAFIVSASKQGFKTRDVFISKTPGAASEYLITLRPEEPKSLEAARSPAAIKASIDAQVKQKVDELMKEAQAKVDEKMKEAQENMHKAEEERRQLLAEKMRLEMEQAALESKKQLGILERTFDVYKDALFSERYSRGPASFDRNRIDTSVDYVNRIQQYIDEKRYDQASALADQLLERDEYFAKGYALKGTVKFLQNKLHDAVVAWERAIEIDPSDQTTKHYLESAYRKLGNQPMQLKIRDK